MRQVHEGITRSRHHCTIFLIPSGAMYVPPARGLMSLKSTITVRPCSPESRKCVNLHSSGSATGYPVHRSTAHQSPSLRIEQR